MIRFPRRMKMFISYRRDDSSGYAGRLYKDLSARFGAKNVFMDIDTISPGTDFEETVKVGVGSCDALIAIVGKRWIVGSDVKERRLNNPNDYVRLELSTALKREIHVIPVLVQGATMPQEQDLPDDLKELVKRQAIEISDARWDYDVKRLIVSLERGRPYLERLVSYFPTLTLKSTVYLVILGIVISAAVILLKVKVTPPLTRDPINANEETENHNTGGAAEPREDKPSTFSALVPIPKPEDINRNVTAAKSETLMEVLGAPCPLTVSCSDLTNAKVKSLVVTENVGPFTVTGLKPAVDALRQIFSDVKNSSPELYEQIQIGNGGMLCCRRLRNSQSRFSNHAWGTAIDISIKGAFVPMGTDKTQVGLLFLYPYFHNKKFFWGAGVTNNADPMHFEASDELIREWAQHGMLN